MADERVRRKGTPVELARKIVKRAMATGKTRSQIKDRKVQREGKRRNQGKK